MILEKYATFDVNNFLTAPEMRDKTTRMLNQSGPRMFDS